MKNILIADDNNQIIEVLKQYALKENYTVFTADNGSKTLEEFHKRDYDVILLDVMMPEIDGFEVCRRIRQTSMVPIIMITARGEDYDKIMGLDIGADDYVIKPFSPSEVMARVRAILRRVESIGISNKEVVQKGSLRINLDKFQVFIHDETVSLTKKEVEILWLLASNAGIVFSRTQILDSVWGFEYFGDSRTIDTHIKRLRSKVDIYEHSDWKILTVRGIGYKFEVIHE
ncbi:response regulator transcription factor [bacterium]|nr:response regulator transcription factor [bacterium]MDY4504023.1 response regulator transcription factor [Bariatricus sp.]